MQSFGNPETGKNPAAAHKVELAAGLTLTKILESVVLCSDSLLKSIPNRFLIPKNTFLLNRSKDKVTRHVLESLTPEELKAPLDMRCHDS